MNLQVNPERPYALRMPLVEPKPHLTPYSMRLVDPQP